MWHGLASSAKGGTPCLWASARVQANLGGFPLFCRENAAVLNLADACLLPNMAPMRFFYGREAIYAGPGFV
jgi:hypothetical protein